MAVELDKAEHEIIIQIIEAGINEYNKRCYRVYASTPQRAEQAINKAIAAVEKVLPEIQIKADTGK